MKYDFNYYGNGTGFAANIYFDFSSESETIVFTARRLIGALIAYGLISNFVLCVSLCLVPREDKRVGKLKFRLTFYAPNCYVTLSRFDRPRCQR